MPNCIGLIVAACQTAVNDAVTAAGGANALPTISDRVDMTLMNNSVPAGRVVQTTPASGAVGKFTAVSIAKNPDPFPIAIPTAQPLETYPSYIARLRNLGWLGVAVVVQLDGSTGDPAYGADGVPCRNIPTNVPVSPDAAIKFYRNPLSFKGQGGGSASGWDCRGDAVPPPLNDCEYDDFVFAEYDWDTGRTYGQIAHDEACAGAWAYFNSIGGPNPATALPERHTGRLKDPDVIAFLTGDGRSKIDDWEKVEWGPFTFSSRGQSLTFVVHGYRHKRTAEVRLGTFGKVKFRTEIAP